MRLKRVVVDKGGALPPQFQGEGSEIGGGSHHDGTSHGGAAREKDLVPFVAQKALPNIEAALDNSDSGGVEVSMDQRGKGGRGGGSQLRGFQHHCIPGRNRTDQGFQGYPEGEIPRGYDEYHSQGFRD